MVANSTKLLSSKSVNDFLNRLTVILSLSAPGAEKLLYPWELSFKLSSKSAFIIC